MNDKSDNKQQARRHQRALNLIKRWRLMDDDFMKRCLKDNIPAVECILRIIMEQPDLEVQTLHVEDTIPNLQGHGVRLDVHATDAMGIEYDIEIQRSDQGAGARRARFNGSVLDLNNLKKGFDYDQLPETYVIFITENDILEHRLSRYHINRIIEETNQHFEDGSHIIYVNGTYRGQDDIGKLMNDFRSTTAEEMFWPPLKEVVNRYKNNPVEVAKMCRELEKWSMEERQEGLVEGQRKGEDNLAKLLKLLKADGRLHDLDLAIEDEAARKALYKEYHID